MKRKMTIAIAVICAAVFIWGATVFAQSTATQPTISYERAKEIAIARVGGGTVKEIELDRDDGRLIYEIEVKYNGREHELDIDATTGEIVKYKIDD